jgi:hypothetical protein
MAGISRSTEGCPDGDPSILIMAKRKVEQTDAFMVKTLAGTTVAVPYLTNQELRELMLEMEGTAVYFKTELPESYWYLVSELTQRHDYVLKNWPYDPVIGNIRDRMKRVESRTEETMLMRASIVRMEQL